MPAANNMALIGRMSESDLALRSALLMSPTWERSYLKLGGDTPSFLSVLAIFGILSDGTFERASDIHLESEAWTPLMTIAASAAPGPGLPVTVTILGPYDTSGNSSVETGILWKLPNGVLGTSTAVNKATPNAHTMTLAVHNNDFPAFAAGTPIMYMGPSVGEAATAVPHLITQSVTAYDHPFQKFLWGTGITDFAMMEGEAWVQTKPMPTPWNSGSALSWTSHQLDLLWQKINWSITASTLFNDRYRMGVRAAGGASYMDGAIPFIQAQGNNFITPTAFTLNHFRSYAKAFKDGRTGSRNRNVMCGMDYMYKVNELLFTLTQQGNHQQAGKDFDFGWTSLTGVGADFTFAPAEIFDDPMGLGAFGFENKAVYLPPKSEMMDDYSDGSKKPKFRLKHFSGGLAGIKGSVSGTPFTYGEMRGLSFTGKNGEYPQTLEANEYKGSVEANLMTDFRNGRAFGFSE